MPYCLNLPPIIATSMGEMMRKLLQVTSQLGRNPIDKVLSLRGPSLPILINNAAIYPSIRRGSGGKKAPPRLTYVRIPSSEPVYEDEALAAILKKG
jgi:hypothetical protein